MASILLLLLTLSHLQFTLPSGTNHITDRKSLEIIIGGGDDGNSPPPSYSPEPDPEYCPPPLPEPPCPPPPMPLCPPPPSPPPPPPKPRSPPPPSPQPPKRSPPKRTPPRKQPPPPQSPPLFGSALLAEAFPILQRFRRLVTSDPKGKLKNWVGNDVCSYNGLDCAKFPLTNEIAVASIQFNEYYLGGKNGLPLAGFLDKLRTVTIFHANSNNFTGSVPDVTNLKFLFELDLSNNKLSGDIPKAVLKATNLTFLDLRFNSFSGCVPPQLFNLDVDVLFINNNDLSQSLPPNLGSITAIYLTFANNRFTGPIPGSIGNIKSLQEVLFLNNQLTGCLPYQIGMLKRATVFDAGSNQLTGPIPYSFGCLDKLEILNLARNKFYGTIPEILCEISSLTNLSLSYNYFTQVGPKCRQLIKSNILDVRMNCILDLPNQKTPWQCAQFFMKKQSCPNTKDMLLIPCGKNPNRERFELGEAVQEASPPLSYGALNPDRMRNL